MIRYSSHYYENNFPLCIHYDWHIGCLFLMSLGNSISSMAFRTLALQQICDLRVNKTPSRVLIRLGDQSISFKVNFAFLSHTPGHIFLNGPVGQTLNSRAPDRWCCVGSCEAKSDLSESPYKAKKILKSSVMCWRGIMYISSASDSREEVLSLSSFVL